MLSTEDIVEKIANFGHELISVSGVNSRAILEIRCKSCNATKNIKYTSLWHKSLKCKNCGVLSIDKDLFHKYLEVSRWKLVSAIPSSQKSEVTVQCLECLHTKTVAYKSFISKPLPCKHPNLSISMKTESDFNLMGFKVHSWPKNSKSSVSITCRRCNTIRKVSLNTIKRVGGCAECKLRQKIARKINAKQIIGRDKSCLRIVCKNHHEYSISTDKAYKRGQKHTCPFCRAQEKNSDFQRYTKTFLAESGFRLLSGNYSHRDSRFEVECINGHKKSITYHSMSHHTGLFQCSECNTAQKQKSYVDNMEKFMGEYGYKLTSYIHTGHKYRILVRCKSGHSFRDLWHIFKTDPKFRCRTCNPMAHRTSRAERELLEWSTTYGGVGDQLIGKYRYDVCFESKKLLIELDGLYYHSCSPLSITPRKKMKHYNKLQNASLLGYNLISIREDEWTHKKDIVKSIVESKLGVCRHKIHARSCKLVSNIPWSEAKPFLVSNHLLGAPNGGRANGLYCNGDLVALVLMSQHHRNSKEWVLSRLCFKSGVHIAGGFSKLVKSLPKPVVTWSDNRYSSGNGYSKNGFQLVSDIKPDYVYIKGKRVHSKQSLRKRANEKTLQLTEFQLRSLEGYRIMYDYGKKRWVLN